MVMVEEAKVHLASLNRKNGADRIYNHYSKLAKTIKLRAYNASSSPAR